MWYAKARICKSRTAIIEAMMGKPDAKLLLYFNPGKIKALRLNNNIKSVVLRTFGKDQNCLNLVFKNNSFLFVEKLTTIDARQLKKFLDKVYKRNLKASWRKNKKRSDGPSTSTQELGSSSPLEVHAEPSSKCFKSAKKRGASVLDELPLSSSSSTTPNRVGSLAKQLVKRKRSLPESKKKETENILQGSRKQSEAKSVVSVHYNKKTERNLRKAKSKPGFGFFSETNNPEESDLSVHDIHDLIAKLFSPFLLEPCYMKKDIEWHEYMKTLLLYPEKTCQGLINTGNTCYINVVLQSLCSVPLFVNELFNQGFPWIRPPRDDFNMSLMQMLVLKDIYNAKTRENILRKLKRALPQFGDIFTADKQNDAHEFLSLCLVQLKETVQNFTVLWQAENGSGRNNLVRQTFANHGIINKIPFCPVASNFDFELKRCILCNACGLAVFSKELSSYLSISIPQGLKGLNLSIQSCFDHFFKAEELERRCERCMHNKSVAVHKFDLLPRVIIIHLKRYSFSESRVVKKDDQHVTISKILKLSYHCNKSTRPPQPIGQNAHVKDLDLLKPLQKLGSEILKVPFNSTMTSGSKYCPTVNTSSKRASEAENVRRVSNVLSGKVQQKHQGKGATQNVIGSELTNKRAKPKKHENTHTFRELDSGSFKRSPKYQQVQKCYEGRSGKQTSREAVTQSHPKPSSQEQIGYFSKPAGSHTQNDNLKLQRSLDSSKNLGSKDILDKKTKLSGKMEPQNVDPKANNYYRLINVISHTGNSAHGGHYINDAFDFKKKNWFTYSDLQVARIQEELVHKARLSTGYVFFYMHNEIFEELLAKESQASKMS
ncbi:Ubiquitin carboxyl-terminal hydrolase 26 [Lemmus lemmus]